MSLENDLDELEVKLGFEPQANINYTNLYGSYPSPFEHWLVSIKKKVKTMLDKIKKVFRKEPKKAWGE